MPAKGAPVYGISALLLMGEAITRQPELDDVVIDQPYSLRIIRPSVSISRYARAPINYSQPLIGRRIAARGLRDGYMGLKPIQGGCSDQEA
jgi:hypothetical protein